MKTNSANQIKFFRSSSSQNLGNKIADHLNITVGNLYQETFQDGEVFVRFDESVRGNVVFILAKVNMPYSNLFELFLSIDAARRASAKEVICIIPYLPHSRQERKEKDRSSIAARVIADFFENVGADRIITIDLHSSSIEGLFKIPIDHLDTTLLFADHINSLGLGDLLLCSPDFGGVKRIKGYRHLVDSDIAVINKERLKANQVAKMEIIGDVNGKNVIIIDDIIDTAGTLCKAAELLIQKGALSVRAYCTHGIFSGNAIERIEKSSLSSIYITDSISMEGPNSEKIHKLSTAPLLAEAMKKLMSRNQ